MIESTTKHEMRGRAAIAVAVWLAWCLFAYVTFVASESGNTVLNIADLDLSKAAAAVALYERIKNAASICAGGRTWALKLSAVNASRVARRLRAGS